MLADIHDDIGFLSVIGMTLLMLIALAIVGVWCIREEYDR